MNIITDNAAGRERASETVAAGGLVAFRTDTFYGLGADPFKLDALLALNELKGRDGKPILVVISDLEAAERLLANRTRIFDALSARHWPGALTLVAAARPEVPELLTSGTGSVGVRLPGDEDVRALVRACGGLLTATSANPAGQPPARTARQVARYFQSEAGLLIIDGGDSRSELPSTVLDTRGPRLIREGVVPRGELEVTLRAIGETLA
ncbi:MAG: L-threonylcarbamoyladenylate synthase [Rubrivivax sp.]|nr:L-threonylcarbamoyladenylate synthase [Pyrinomonadaceae bacterium]